MKPALRLLLLVSVLAASFGSSGIAAAREPTKHPAKVTVPEMP